MTPYNSDSHSRHPNVCNEQPFMLQTTCVLRMSLSSDTLHFLWSFCQGTPVRLACSRQSTQLAWLAGTGAAVEHRVVLPMCILQPYTVSAGADRWILSLARPPTLMASEALDPVERRLFLLADQPENRPIRRSQNMKGICKV